MATLTSWDGTTVREYPTIEEAHCEARAAYGAPDCRRPASHVTQLAHVGVGPETTCVTGEFLLCETHLRGISAAVSQELKGHTAPRCESCHHPMRSIRDVVMEAVRIS